MGERRPHEGRHRGDPRRAGGHVAHESPSRSGHQRGHADRGPMSRIGEHPEIRRRHNVSGTPIIALLEWGFEFSASLKIGTKNFIACTQ